MRFTVYQTTNLVNGKIYIGAHATENPNDSYLGSGNLLQRAVRKYGRVAFKKEILFDFDTEAEMLRKEAELVTPEWCRRRDTYNVIRGGGNYFPLQRSNPGKFREIQGLGLAAAQKAAREDPEAQRAIRENGQRMMQALRARGLSGAAGAFRGRRHSEQTKEAMRAAARTRSFGEGNSQFGTVWVVRPGERPKKIPKDQLEQHLLEGWARGRKSSNRLQITGRVSTAVG